jgi:UDP-glucuronate 4-epimerase
MTTETSNINTEQKKVLVTGAAGFIGYHFCESLLKLGHSVIGLDSINDYYDVNLKYNRLKQLEIERDKAEVFQNTAVSSIHGEKMMFVRMNPEDRVQLPDFFKKHSFSVVCNLAAQVGVRYSLLKPEAYIDSNINGFLNLLECCRNNRIKRLVYASRSIIYGDSSEVPFCETANVNTPISLYAATKKSNELMAYAFIHFYDIETIGLKFFTVYGSWGRPDMAMFLFTKAILNNKPIKLFNHGDLSRDFTFVDDIVQGVVGAILKDSKNTQLSKIYNIVNGKPIQLLDFIKAIGVQSETEAIKVMLPMHAGNVNTTWASTVALQKDYGYSPSVDMEEGISKFVDWYKNYFKN